MCEKLTSTFRNPYDIVIFQGVVINRVKSYNNIWWAASFGEDILRDWDTRHAATLGTWNNFLLAAFKAITNADALTLNQVKRCNPCDQVPTKPKDLTVSEAGEVQW